MAYRHSCENENSGVLVDWLTGYWYIGKDLNTAHQYTSNQDTKINDRLHSFFGFKLLALCYFTLIVKTGQPQKTKSHISKSIIKIKALMIE